MLKRLCAVIATSTVIGVAAAAPASAAPPASSPSPVQQPYYLGLGDSLAQGVQPTSTGASVETNQGYVDDLYATLRREHRGLQLAKLGCPGETTGTMIHGGICPYPLTSQLAQAVAFLHTHRVTLITIDIGSNNVDGCVTGGNVDLACVAAGIAAASTDLPVILSQLRTAAGPNVPIIGMNYYDPFLAAWLTGPAGQALAKASVPLVVQFNSVLQAVYKAFQVPVADVQSAFLTTNFTVIPWFGNLPLNVLVICALTWMCAPAPVGPNVHANATGYRVIAHTFAEKAERLDVLHPASA